MRFFFILLMLFYFFHLLILQGRSGYVTFVLLSPLIVYNLFKKRNIFKILLVSVLLVAMMLLSPIVRNRISQSVDQLKYHINIDKKSAWGKEYTVKHERFYLWYGAVRIFKDNPFIGVGTGGYGRKSCILISIAVGPMANVSLRQLRLQIPMRTVHLEIKFGDF